ncbi:hypothetical protein [Aurantiacibacter poecillastricola]|uniref:hypothetical protein n=1 Tax=Aurantiacibacter poecillastricola TaxID=3064385 RepID=UPI00273F93EB|nr:hypothetical protein [Aurantiacibacter sp. 219JJ12-13]MDP5260049.1 hypothetical protein [Aurantiacibacter sp. 219JJ12-13]
MNTQTPASESMGAGPSTPSPAANENFSVDQNELPVDALAKAVLAREIRPRVGSVRRLAEAVIVLQGELKAAKKDIRKAKKSARAGAPEPKKKKNKKLAKIPGQKKDRKA